MNELVYQAAARARVAPAIPSVKARRPGMYMPATAMPLTARQISAGSRPSLKAMPKQDSAFSALLARKICTGRHPIGKRNQWQHGRHVAGGHHTGEPASLGVAQRPRHDELRQQSGDQRKAGQAQDFRPADECDGMRGPGRVRSAVDAPRAGLGCCFIAFLGLQSPSTDVPLSIGSKSTPHGLQV